MFEKVVSIDPKKLRFTLNYYKTHNLCKISMSIYSFRLKGCVKKPLKDFYMYPHMLLMAVRFYKFLKKLF